MSNSKEFNTRKMVINAILLAIGVILRYFTPASIGIQMDLSLAMLFIIIVINDDYKSVLISGIISGIFAALTTKTPNGQIPIFIEKLITSNVLFLLLMPLRNKLNEKVQIILLMFFGTILSGSTFILILSAMSNLTKTFGVMFIGVVIPAAIANSIIGFLLYGIVKTSLKRINMSLT